jgi:hypothetical protein
MERAGVLSVVFSLAGILAFSIETVEAGGQPDKVFPSKPGQAIGVYKITGQGKGSHEEHKHGKGLHKRHRCSKDVFRHYEQDDGLYKKYRNDKSVHKKPKQGKYGNGNWPWGSSKLYSRLAFYMASARNARGTYYKGSGPTSSIARERAMSKCRYNSLYPSSCYIISLLRYR